MAPDITLNILLEASKSIVRLIGSSLDKVISKETRYINESGSADHFKKYIRAFIVVCRQEPNTL